MRLSSRLDSIEESTLVQQALDGDQQAAAELDSRYRPLMLRFLRSRVVNPSDAEDVAQISLAKAFASLEQFQIGSSFSAWLHQIAANAAIDWQRSASRRHELQEFEVDVDVLAVDTTTTSNSSANEIFEKARTLLSTIQYEIVWRYYVDQQSIKDISIAVNISQITVRVHLFRARRTLKRFVREGEA